MFALSLAIACVPTISIVFSFSLGSEFTIVMKLCGWLIAIFVIVFGMVLPFKWYRKGDGEDESDSSKT